MALLAFLGARAGAKLRKAGVREFVVPEERCTLLGFFDLFVESFVNFHDSILGKENRKYASFTGALFMFLLFSNFLGLIPGMAAITTTVQVNVGLAIVVFLYFNYLGIRTQGVKNYLKHFCGPIWWLAVLIFPVEVFGVLLRPITLNLRLYWNVTADHTVLSIFTDQVIPGFGLLGLPFYVLGSFVSFMQAFVFTTLTMVYILFAVQHEEH
jgi:F-type H+-transporting ATPase subunit a